MAHLNSFKLNDPAVLKLLRKFEPNDTIFTQGKPGKTMYIVMDGFVRILHNSGHAHHLIGILGSGEVLGEKAILPDTVEYTRNFTAQAKTDATLLEIDKDALKIVLSNWPDFHMRMLSMVEDRLDKANQLISILQYPEPLERLTQYVLYFHSHHAKKLPKGTYITMTVDEIRHAVNLDKKFVESCLESLVKDKILSSLADGYVLTDAGLLKNHLPKLKLKIAA